MMTRFAAVAFLLLAPMAAQAACAATELVERVAASASRSGPALRRATPSAMPACLVRAEAIPPTALLLDVRDSKTRARLRINDASVVELADLPGWDAPHTDLALVGSGLNQAELVTHCSALRRRGVQAAVIDGGIQALPAVRLAPASTMDAAAVDAESVVNTLRSERDAVLVAFNAEELPEGSVEVSPHPTAASIRALVQRSGPRIFVGDRPTVERWWSALRGAGATRVFIYDGSVQALRSASAKLDSVHQGRHWVAPSPCERQG